MIKFENTINVLDNVFGIRRIVDAKNKNIINFDENKDINSDYHCCFDFWKTGKECINCISMRSLNENKSYSKFETVDNKLYMIISAPIKIKNDIYVAELVKDISEDTLSQSFDSLLNKELKEEILRLNELVVTDELTSIFNRRFLNEKLPYSIKQISNIINSLSIVIIDVDKFKYINDSYGHTCGDYILKNISSILKDFSNKHMGWVARYGGDEFIMAFENLSEESTYDLCNNLKDYIKEKEFCYKDKIIKVSCSYGVTVITNNDISVENIFSDIDNKLFVDKINI